jgi:formyltetrahydrofolate deformylase
MSSLVLTLQCTDRPGIVGAVGTFLAERRCNILDSAQFGDAGTGQFMMRVAFERLESAPDEGALAEQFGSLAQSFGMDWRLKPSAKRERTLLLVSRQDHCVNDLLYRHRIGALPIEPVGVVSNHPDAVKVAASYGAPFYHLPLTQGTKHDQEARLRQLIETTGAELIVLARYMQILSDEMCDFLQGRAINIHHSFLPGFKGAQPYRQAYERGVKLIGATAHYVTKELDEGPIIDQRVVRVSHAHSPEDLAAAGRDVECSALANAVKYHVEQRVFLNGSRCVVFA